MKYLITSYQVVNADGSRDTVRLLQTKGVDDIEAYREELKRVYNCKLVNINYMEKSE